MESIK